MHFQGYEFYRKYTLSKGLQVFACKHERYGCKVKLTIMKDGGFEYHGKTGNTHTLECDRRTGIVSSGSIDNTAEIEALLNELASEDICKPAKKVVKEIAETLGERHPGGWGGLTNGCFHGKDSWLHGP